VMIREAYRALLRLHPAPFRREFAGEMLWIFDEASASEGVCTLFLDGLISLTRQWVVRSGSWKIGAAILGAMLQVSLGGLGWLAVQHPRIAAATAREQFKGEWIGEVKTAQGSRRLELQLVPAGTAWVGRAVLNRDERGVRDVRVSAGAIRFGLNVDGSTLWFEGRRASLGGQVSGVVRGVGTFHLVRE
jgi:hypothetical protein